VCFLGGQLGNRVGGPFAYGFAGGQQFPEGAVGEPFDAHCDEHLVGRAELLTCVDASVLAAQPFAAEQMRACQVSTHPGTAEPLDRLAVEVLGDLALAQ
jgi:hypothetical protein